MNKIKPLNNHDMSPTWIHDCLVENTRHLNRLYKDYNTLSDNDCRRSCYERMITLRTKIVSTILEFIKEQEAITPLAGKE